MNIAILPLDFMGQAPLLQPADQKLHDLAVDYCRRELAEEITLAKLQKCWVAVEIEDGEYRAIHGISGFVWKIDVPVFRVSGNHAVAATKLLIDRMRAFFQDSGARGGEAFIHISSKELPEQRCHRWEESLKAVGAVPADRFSVTI